MNRKNYIIWQYRNKPQALGTIRAIYQETDLIFQNIIQIADILNINTATGYALDLIGRHVGVSRVLPTALAKEYFGWMEDDNALSFGVGEFYRYGDALSSSVVLSDSDYRFFIRARITKNYQTGTIENIVKSIQFVIDKHCNVIDAQDMSMNIIVNKDRLNQLTLYATSKMDIFVRPAGVLYRYIILTNSQPFGFAHDNDSYGFNMGAFVRLQEIGIN